MAYQILLNNENLFLFKQKCTNNKKQIYPFEEKINKSTSTCKFKLFINSQLKGRYLMQKYLLYKGKAMSLLHMKYVVITNMHTLKNFCAS
jgi:hypothetical protein